MIPPEIHTEIMCRLRKVEECENVRILLAVESGSRAWGFESPNSDFDVRFIYLRNTDWYLSVNLEEKRDVIEYGITDDIDLNGWDIRKALRLFLKSNPAFVEWIQSPIVYIENGIFANHARRLLQEIYSLESGIYHYRSMAKTNYRGYLRDDLVPIKKYFYALRPLLSVRWLEKYKEPAPIEFEKLIHLIADKPQLVTEINSLLLKKKAVPEMGLEPKISIINEFIESELDRLEEFNERRKHDDDSIQKLNLFFKSILNES